MHRFRSTCLALLVVVPLVALGEPYVPASDAAVLAQVPPGARHAATPELAATRLDIALPLARLDISRARAGADLRFLGYAEALLAPWMQRPEPPAQVLVLHAEILQSRHEFAQSLEELERALQERPGDVQGWLTRATVLRVLGRFEEARQSCDRLLPAADGAVAGLCVQSLRGLTGHLEDAYRTVRALSARDGETRAWQYSELGEMAARLGDALAAERWFRAGLESAPLDLYMRTALADVLLREDHPEEVLTLLAGDESMEPALLRLVIAHRLLRDGRGAPLEARLSAAFAIELRREEPVHRREQARFLLDVEADAGAALEAARENWRVQREPEDALILLRAAAAAHDRRAAQPVFDFLRRTGLEDRRLAPWSGAS